MSNQIFADGVNIFAPKDNAPEFIKGQLVIDLKALSAWVASNDNYITKDSKGNSVLRLDIKTSKQGKLYASVNTYQPDGNKVIAQAAREKVNSPMDDMDDDGSLPF